MPTEVTKLLHLLLLAGVAEQFAIAEAKLRAWASTEEEEEEDSADEDPLPVGKTGSSPQSSGTFTVPLTSSIHITEQPSHPPLHLNVSPGVLTFCSSLRCRHVPAGHRSAAPI